MLFHYHLSTLLWHAMSLTKRFIFPFYTETGLTKPFSPSHADHRLLNLENTIVGASSRWKNPDDFKPAHAFDKNLPHGWCSAANAKFPQTIYVNFENETELSKISFKPVLTCDEKVENWKTKYPINTAPTDFDIVATNVQPCDYKVDWRVLVNMRNIQWKRCNQETRVTIPKPNRAFYFCYGIRVSKTNWGEEVTALSTIKMWGTNEAKCYD